MQDMFPIFTKLGGESAVLEILSGRSGRRPTPEAVRMWKRQRRIPALRAIELLDECWGRGIRVAWPADFEAEKNDA